MSGRNSMTWELAEKHLNKAIKAKDATEIAYWTRMRDGMKAATWNLSPDGKTATNAATGETKPWP